MVLFVACLTLNPLWCTGLHGEDSVNENPQLVQDRNIGARRLEISYFLHLQPRMASNQFAVWIEDSKGNYIDTVFATNYTARGGYEQRPLSLQEWRESADWDQAESGNVDAVSGATPLSGKHTAVWDCTDEQGRAVAPGRYIYKMEGNIFWENRVVWTGEIELGNTPDESRAKPRYFPEKAHRKGILLEDVRARYLPE
ncbi:MAG: DUF2271 domain-containing protein [Desulfonatronovibrio sp.]